MVTAEKFAELNPNICSRLAVKRALLALNIFLYCPPMIDEICIVNITQGEEGPAEFHITNKYINPKNSSSDKILISYHRRDPIGLCDIQFECCTLDKYPDKVLLLFSLSLLLLLILLFFKKTTQ